MYIADIPNRNSPKAILLREGYREDGKIKNRTLANLSKLPPEAIDAVRRTLKGVKLVAIDELFEIVEDGSPSHGHVEAVLTAMKRLGLASLIAARSSCQRGLVITMVAARCPHEWRAHLRHSRDPAAATIGYANDEPTTARIRPGRSLAGGQAPFAHRCRLGRRTGEPCGHARAPFLPVIRLPAIRRLGRVMLATAAMLAGCAADPDADLAFYRAENALAQGRHDWARLYFRADLERHPERLASLRGEALSWLSGYQRSLSSGIDACRRYIEHGDDPEVVHALVSSLLLLGEWDEARTWTARLDDSVASDLLRVEAWMDVDTEVATAALERLFAREPANARAHAWAVRLAEKAGDLDRAVDHARATLASDPFAYQTVYQLARLRQRQGDAEEARALFATQRLLSRAQHDGTTAPLPPAEALAALETLAPLVASDTYLFQHRLVDARYAAGRREEAEDAMRALLERPEITPGDRQTFATWAGERGSRSLSRRLFAGLLDENPSNRGARASLAQLDLDGGDLASARARLEEGLSRDPHFARYHHLLALVAQAEDRVGEAFQHHRRALRLAPFEHAWRLHFAELLRAEGRHEELRQLLDEAPETNLRVDAYRLRHAALLDDPTRD